MSTLLRSGGRYAGIGGAARVFALLAITVPIVWLLDFFALVGLLLLASVWMASLTLSGWSRLPQVPLLVVEAALVSVVVATTVNDSALLVPALAVTPFVAGAVRGPVAVGGVLAVEVMMLAATSFQLHEPYDASTGGAVFTWIIAGLGFGLLASFARTMQFGQDELTPYRDAHELISKLLELSGDLTEGLDAVSISQSVVAEAREEVPFVGAVVYIRRGELVTPLAHPAEDGALDSSSREKLVQQVWDEAEPAIDGHEVAFPLCTDAGVVAVVAAALPTTVSVDAGGLTRTLASLTSRFRPEALRLDTALLFDAVRSAATAEERRRLAREVHDGVAQDVASLGYLVDDLEDSATTEDQRNQFRLLRQEISSVVAELRRSVFSLRNETTHTRSLGEGISALARHVTTVSGLPVHVSLDEGSARLRPEVEAELLRITQEGMNNVVKHAGAANIWVDCTVLAPSAHIVVRDDGRGVGRVRHDSHGLRIMHERAQLVGATVTLQNGPEGGAVLTVDLNVPGGRRGTTTSTGSETEGLVKS